MGAVRTNRPETAAFPTGGLSLAGAFLRACRPKQWTKNLLVLAVPAAAGALDRADVLGATALALVAFTLVSSGTYLLNDAADVDADRLHPVKGNRPIAAGLVPPRVAVIGGLVLLALGLGVALAANPGLFGVVVGYVALTAAYTRRLKHEPVFDIAIVASGFFLRAVAGGVASDLFISRWFLIVAAGGSLFLITGKRYAEKVAGGDASGSRTSLRHYSADYLRGMLSTAAGITVIAYCLWAFERTGGVEPSGWRSLSAIPFVLGIMRYGLLVDQGHGEEPEEVLLGDRVLLILGGIWLTLLVLGVAT